MSRKAAGYEIPVTGGRMSSLAAVLLDGASVGEVHSCFRTSLNLRFGEHLIHLDGGEQGLCAYGLSVKPAEMERILACCRVGDLAAGKKGRLRLYGTGGLIRLELGSSATGEQENGSETGGQMKAGFETVDLRLDGWSRGMDPADGQNGREVLLRVLEGQKESLLKGLGLPAEEDFYRYGTALGSGDAREREETVRYFLGRGRGLTPAGDDILTGCLAAWKMFGYKGFNGWAEALRREMSRTTDVSKAYLYAVTEGYGNERFLALPRLAAKGDARGLSEALEQIRQTGHTSGCDTLYGMYLGLTIMKEDSKL